ncbi:Leukotoxin export ATP-binding protein LtxB [Caulobacter sp. NIBR1757]|nr:Leukotoxin export ATP-binding protein LtxB [Caulobacter sp. NIBR1757]
MVAPLYMQIIIDRALSWSIKSLILPTAAFFLIVYAVQALLGYLRSMTLEGLSRRLGRELSASVAAHLLTIPVRFFLSRGPADVLSKFQSVHRIKIWLTRDLVDAVINVLVLVISAAIMLSYDPTLSAVSGALVLGICGFRFFWAEREAALTQKEVVTSAQEAGAMLQNIRAIQSIKAQGLEAPRFGIWRKSHWAYSGASFSSRIFGARINEIEGLLLAIENLLIVAFGAFLILNKQLTLGVLLAFFVYRLYVRQRALSLVRTAVQLRSSRIHLDRVHDLLDQPPENGIFSGEGNPLIHLPRIVGEIEFQDVSFRYAANDRDVLQNVTFRIAPGEAVGLTGASGSGKSTLIRLMLGLVRPTKGRVLIDGIDIDRLYLPAFRQRVGIVLQDDEVFEGTIRENITNFDDTASDEAVRAAAEAANIAQEIDMMPMGFDTPLSAGAGTFSSGQKQRIYLARLFYRSPALIILDEGTANLDPANDQRVAAVLSEIPVTRIYVAHSSALLQRADRTFSVRDGRVAEAVSTAGGLGQDSRTSHS